ncbi:hypothetical protein CVT24_003350 [Panaeolus cyanescens]|uniref:Uncharacterized protein n=1 Tax=Panaeolus cyanescens TaxID=181874 RepID=A0A409Y764_9AGAR|nr:hypothetical protein CVT24_003350 [Panaeolus cyanescens]
MRLFYLVFCAVTVARLPVYAATISKVLPQAEDLSTGNLIIRQIHSADFSSKVAPESSTELENKSTSAPANSVTVKEGERHGSAKFSKRDSGHTFSFLSNSGGKPQAFYDSHASEGPASTGNQDSESLAALRRFIGSDIMEKMPVRPRDVTLPSGVNSHTVDPSSIPGYVGLETPPHGVQSAIDQQHALSKMIARGIELPEFIKPHSINFVARSDGDDGNEDEDEEDTKTSEDVEEEVEEEGSDNDNDAESSEQDSNDDGQDSDEGDDDKEDSYER